MKAASPEHMEELKSVNSKIIAKGEVLPAVTMKDGSRVQTGTVAAMLFNIDQYNKGERGEIERELELAVPTLFKVGLFDLFDPKEWMKGKNPGRRFVGKAAIRYLETSRLRDF